MMIIDLNVKNILQSQLTTLSLLSSRSFVSPLCVVNLIGPSVRSAVLSVNVLCFPFTPQIAIEVNIFMERQNQTSSDTSLNDIYQHHRSRAGGTKCDQRVKVVVSLPQIDIDFPHA